MAKYLPLPDGSSLKVPDSMTYEEAMSKAKIEFPDLFADPNEKKPQGGFVPALKSGISSLKGDVAALAGKTGIMDEAAAEKKIKAEEEYRAKTFKPTEESWSEAPGTKIKELLGGSLPYMAAPVAAGFLAPEGAAALGATGLASLAQFTGSNLSRQMGEGKSLKETSLGSAAAGAIPQAALDVVSLKMIPGVRNIFGQAGKKMTTAEAEAFTKQGIAKIAGDYALSTGKAMGTEGLTEAAQQFFERMQAGLNLTDAKARDEYWDSLVGGAVLGGTLSPVGRYIERGGEKAKANQVIEADQRVQEAKQKQAAMLQAKQEAEAAEALKQDPAYMRQFVQEYDTLEAQYNQLRSGIKKLGADASFAEKDAQKELKAKLKELGGQLQERTPEYRQAVAALNAVPKGVEANAPIPTENQQDLLPETGVGGPAAGAAEAAQSEQERAMYGPESRMAQAAQTFGQADLTTGTAREEEAPDYEQQARQLKARLDELRTMAASTKDLDEKIKLGEQYTQAQQSLAKAQEEAKNAPKKIGDQIGLLRKKMEVAEEEGDIDAQVKIAKTLKSYGISDITGPIEQTNIPLKPFKSLSETTAEFNDRVVGPEMGAGREAAAAQRKKVEGEIDATRRLGQGDEYATPAKKDYLTGKEIKAVEDQAVMNKARTDQYSLFGPETGSRAQVRTDAQGRVVELPGKDLQFEGAPETRSEVQSGTGALSTKSRGRLVAEFQIAKAAGNRPAMANALEAIRDFDAKKAAEATPTAKEFDTEELAKAAGPKMPGSVAAQQKAAEARDAAYAKVVELVSKFNQGRAAQTELDAARDSLLANMVNDIEATRGTQMSTAEKLQVQDKANKLLNELVARFGDTRNTSSVGTKKNQAFQPAQELTSEAQVTTKTSSETGNVTKTYSGYVNRDGDPISLSIVRKPDGSIFRMFVKDTETGKQAELSPGYGPGVSDEKIVLALADAGDWEKTSSWQFNTEDVPGMGYFTAESKGPGSRTFGSPYAAAMSIQEGLDVIRNEAVGGKRGENAVETTRTPTRATKESVRALLDRVLARDTGAIPANARTLAIELADNLKAMSPANLELAQDWLYRVANGQYYEAPTRDLVQMLKAMDVAKRSETEGGKTAVQEELPGVAPAGTMFRTAEEFDKYLAGDALQQIRSDQGLISQTVSRWRQRLAPMLNKANALRGQLGALELNYAKAKKVSAEEVDLAKEMSAQAKANLKAVIDRLDTELHGLQIAYIQANLAFNAAVTNSDKLYADIEANAERFTAPERDALDVLTKAQEDRAKLVKKGPTTKIHAKETLDFSQALKRGKDAYAKDLADVQARIVQATKAFHTAVAANPVGYGAPSEKPISNRNALRFISADLQYQMQLQQELDAMNSSAEDMLNASLALELAKQKQDRSYKNKREMKAATSDAATAAQMEEEAQKAADLRNETAKKEMLIVKAPLNDAERVLANFESKEQAAAERAAKGRNFTRQETQAEREDRDNELRRLETELNDRLAAIPGERITFEKRTKMMTLLNAAPENKAKLDETIEDCDRALKELDTQKATLEGVLDAAKKANSILGKIPTARRTEEDNVTLAQARDKIEQIPVLLSDNTTNRAKVESIKQRAEKGLVTLAKKEAEFAQTFSNDPEIANKVWDNINKRIDKLQNVRIPDAETKAEEKGLSPELRASREDAVRKYKRELKGLEVRRATRKGITRTEIGEATPATEAVVPGERLDAFRKIGPIVKNIRTGKVTQAGKPRGISGTKAVKDTVKEDKLRQAFERIDYLDDLYARTETALARAETNKDAERVAKLTDNLRRIEKERVNVEKRTEGFTPMGLGTDATEAVSSVQTMLTEEGQDALADNRTLDVLRDIVENSKVPFLRENAEKLMQFVSRTRIMYAPDITVDGKAVPAAYNAEQNAVGVRPGFETESNVVHELTHAATMRALEGPESALNDDQLAAKREITSIYNQLTEDGTLSGQYAAKNVKEFVSEVQSNVDLRKKLGSTKLLGSTALRKIADYLMQLIGFKPSRIKTEEAQAVIERLYMQSGKLQGVATSPIGFGATAPKYGVDNNLSKLANKIIAQPKSFKERMGSNLALEAEMQTIDMRAGVREALKLGSEALGDKDLYTQAMYNLKKADQYMPLVSASLAEGPLKITTDDRGLHRIESSGKNSAADLFDAVSDIPAGNVQGKFGLFTTYLGAIRAENKGLSALDLGMLGVTEDELKAALADVRSDPKLEKIYEHARYLYNQYNKGQIDFLASTGKIPKALAADLMKDGDYVPYYRVREDGTAELVLGGEKTLTIGDVRHQPYLHELKGGDTKILPLNESIMRNTMLLTRMGLGNLAAKEIAYSMQKFGEGHGPIGKDGKPTNAMAIHKGRNPGGPNIITFNQEPDPKDPDDDGQRYVRIHTEGTPIEGIPSALIVKSLEGTHLTLPGFLKVGGFFGDLLRKGVTRMPPYILRQLVRDPMAATFTAGLDYNPLTASGKAIKQFVAMQRGESKTGAELIKKGLVQSGIFTGDPDDMSAFALQLASGKDAPAIDRFIAMIDRAAMSADSATRALVYENAIKNGLSEVEAELMVMESMNFYNRGLSPTIQYANRLIPFFNAQLQGLNVLFKAMRGNMPYNERLQLQRKFYNNAMLLVGTGIIYAMAMEDDEYFKNAKPRDKYGNFFMHLPGVEEPVKIPVPYEAGFFFSLAVAAADAMKAETDGPQQLRALRDMFLNSVPGYSSMGAPQAIKPLMEVWTNKNFFSGYDIESASMRHKLPEDRYTANTTEAAKGLAKVLPGFSPVQIEHLARGYFGSLPLTVAAAANDMLRSEGKPETPAPRASDMPVFGSMFQRKFGGADADVVFRLADEAKQAASSFAALKKTGSPDELRDFMAEHKAEIVIAPLANKYTKYMSKLKTQEDVLRNRSNLSEEELRKRLDDLDAIRQQMSGQFMQKIKSVEESLGKT